MLAVILFAFYLNNNKGACSAICQSVPIVLHPFALGSKLTMQLTCQKKRSAHMQKKKSRLFTYGQLPTGLMTRKQNRRPVPSSVLYLPYSIWGGPKLKLRDAPFSAN